MGDQVFLSMRGDVHVHGSRHLLNSVQFQNVLWSHQPILLFLSIRPGDHVLFQVYRIS